MSFLLTPYVSQSLIRITKTTKYYHQYYYQYYYRYYYLLVPLLLLLLLLVLLVLLVVLCSSAMSRSSTSLVVDPVQPVAVQRQTLYESRQQRTDVVGVRFGRAVTHVHHARILKIPESFAAVRSDALHAQLIDLVHVEVDHFEQRTFAVEIGESVDEGRRHENRVLLDFLIPIESAVAGVSELDAAVFEYLVGGGVASRLEFVHRAENALVVVGHVQWSTAAFDPDVSVLVRAPSVVRWRGNKLNISPIDEKNERENETGK